VFHVYDGVWEATDTTVQYAYGVSFSDKSRGVLRGTRFRAGPRPDAVIASGQADITLVDSDFPLALGVYTHQGGSVTLDLPVKTPVTKTYDATNLTPGVAWRMQLEDTTAGHWFVFLRNIGMRNPPCTVTLRQSRRLIVSLLGHNLQGDLRLSNDLSKPVQLGSVTLRRADQPVGVSMWALYFSGDKTDVTIRGRTHICELMHRGGRLRFLGDPNDRALSIGCTTLEMSNAAVMHLEHVHLGRPLTWQDDKAMGEANVAGSARLVARDVSVRNVVFHTRDQGEVTVAEMTNHGVVVVREDGGPVRLSGP
jgi:hypothetical protein